jgi:uncharacterized protein YkwD
MDSLRPARIPARRFALAASAALCAFALVAPAGALAADTTARTQSQIEARAAQLARTYSGNPYAVAPHLSSPFTTGSLTSGELNDGLKSVNYARYLAGVPDDLTLDAGLNDKAQHGADLLAVGTFAHSQPQPAGMDSTFYQIANSATSASNIGYGFPHLWDFNISCMDDSDTGNIDRLGHRRWILNPSMLKTGMGWANNRTDMYVFDFSRPAGTYSYDAIKWPSAGLFPTNMMAARTAWSVTLNPALYGWTAGTAGKTVTMVRQRDGRAWTFNSADTNKSGEYFNFDTSGYGVFDCLIFRPDPASVGGYQNGDVFTITISGITNKSTGQPTTLSYRTTFFTPGGAAVTPAPAPAPAPAPSGSTSGQVSLRSSLWLGASAKTVRAGRTLRFTGSIAPRYAPGSVTLVLQRYYSGRWHTYARKQLGLSAGNYSYSFKPKRRGSWRFYATYAGGYANLVSFSAAKSNTRYVRVK